VGGCNIQTDWGAEFPGYAVRISAMTALMCMVLTRETFQHVVATYPSVVQVQIKIKMIKKKLFSMSLPLTYCSVVQVHLSSKYQRFFLFPVK
jgi:hypothetical protein